MLLNLDPEFQQPVASMLKWLCFSRVLKLDELAEIFVLHPEETTILDESERLFNSRDVLKYLGGFVVESDDDVLLAHFSIKEYLTSQRVSQGPASAFAFSEEDARFHIAHTCLIYHLDVTRTDNLNMWGTLEDPGPLSECAVWEWAPHLERLPYESWPVHVVAAARRALAPGSSSLAYIARCHLRFEDFAGAVKRGQPPHRLTLRLGFRQVTEMLISTDEYLIQEDLDRALQEAVHAGDSSMVEMLLDRGADVNGEAEPWGSALHAAATEGHAELVGLLLDKGAAINAHPLGRVGSALQAAAAENRLDIVKLLVARDAEICTEGVCGVALGARAYQSHEMLVLLLDKGANNTCKHNTAPHEVVRSLVRRYDGERSLELLLARGFDLNALGGEDYGYPVHWACRTGELYDVQHVLGKGADIHAVGGRFGSVMQAASSSNVRGAEDDCPILEYLQEQGADVNARGGRYGTALQAACYNSTYKDTTPDFSDSMEGTVDLYISALRAAELRVQMLLDYGADVNASGGIYDNALQAAALGEYDSMSDGVLGMLLNRGANVNKKGGKYGTALQAAAAVGNAKNVQSLLDHGAEVNAEGGEYGTALQAACSLGRDFRWSRAAEGSAYDTARLLLDSGADVHIQGGRFGDAWHAAAGGPTRYNTTSNWKELMQLLLDEGVDVNDARGRLPHAPTALHAVVQTCSDVSEKLDFLLEHGADPNLTAGTYGTLLQAACAARDDDGHTIDSEDAVRALLDRQRCSDMDVNAQGGLFGCALQAAAYSGQTATIRLLLDAGADVNLRGGKYGSALNASVVKGYWDDVELLLEAGAEPDCWSLPEIDREWLGRVREEDGRGAAERYEKFWERQLEKRAG
jgi:ankyrin repeat protein